MDKILQEISSKVSVPEDIFKLESFFADEAIESSVKNWCDEYLKALAYDPKNPPEGIHFRTATLGGSRSFYLELSLSDSGTTHIVSQPFIGMAKIIGDSNMHYDVYELPTNWTPETFDNEASLGSSTSITASKGDIIFFDGRNSVIDCKTPDCLMLKVMSVPISSKAWAFCRSTKRALYTHESLSLDSQIVLAISALGRLGNQDSVKHLEFLATNHNNHSVRWEAIKAVASLSEEKAVSLLRNAVSDVHPHISNAAKSTLELNGY